MKLMTQSILSRSLRFILSLVLLTYLIDTQAIALELFPPNATSSIAQPSSSFEVGLPSIITGNHVDMKLGKYGIESVKETNGQGKTVRTESYKYDEKNRTYTYNIHDTEPTSIETSQGSKTSKGKGTYEASGVVKYDAKNRITFSEENKTLKSSRGKTIYSYHDKLENVTFDKLDQRVSFHKETSEKGMGIKKYSTTITRVGTVDSTNKLNFYRETEITKTKQARISRTYEARPEYTYSSSGVEKLQSEHREMTSEKISRSFGIKQIIGTVASAVMLGALPAVLNLISTLDPNGVIGKIAGIASSVMMTVAGSIIAGPLGATIASTFNGISQGVIAGQDMKQIMTGALINAGIGLVTWGANAAANGIMGSTQAVGESLTKTMAKDAIVRNVTTQLISRSVMTFAGDKLGPVWSSVIGGTLGALTGDPSKITQNIVLGAIKGTASGFIGQALGGSVGAQFATAAIGGITDAAIDKAGNYVVSEYKKAQYNIAAEKALPKDALAHKNNDGYIQYGTVDKKDGTQDVYSYNGKTNSFEYQYTGTQKGEVVGTGHLWGAGGAAFIPTLEAKGSITRDNGITIYRDVTGNFIEAIPDHQIAIYPPKAAHLGGQAGQLGNLIATKLPVSALTMGMGRDILFSPITMSLPQSSSGNPELIGGEVMGLVPLGATLRTENNQIIGSETTDTSGNQTLYRSDGTKEAYIGRDGSLISYDSRGEASYVIASDGRAASFTFAGDPIILGAQTQVDHDGFGNLVLKEPDNSYRIYDQKTDLLTEASNGNGKFRMYEYDNQNRLYGIAEDDLTQQRQNLYGADGKLIFTTRNNAVIITNDIGEAVGSSFTIQNPEGAQLIYLSDELGNEMPINGFINVANDIYGASKDAILNGLTQGLTAGKTLWNAITTPPPSPWYEKAWDSATDKAQALKNYLGSERFQTLKINMAWAGIDGTYQVLKYPASIPNTVLGAVLGSKEALGMTSEWNSGLYDTVRQDERPGFQTGREAPGKAIDKTVEFIDTVKNIEVSSGRSRLNDFDLNKIDQSTPSGQAQYAAIKQMKEEPVFVKNLLNEGTVKLLGDEGIPKYDLPGAFEINGRRAEIIFTNGIWNGETGAQESRKNLQGTLNILLRKSEVFEQAKVGYIHNKSQLFGALDIPQAAGEYLGMTDDTSKFKAYYVNAKMKADPNLTLILDDHSQGALKDFRTWNLIDDQYKNRIYVVTNGGAQMGEYSGAKAVVNIIKVGDLVPIGSTARAVVGRGNEYVVVIPADSAVDFIPGVSLNNHGYVDNYNSINVQIIIRILTRDPNESLSSITKDLDYEKK